MFISHNKNVINKNLIWLLLITFFLPYSFFAAVGDACSTAESITPGITCSFSSNKTISGIITPSNTPCNTNNGKFYWMTFNTGGKTSYVIKSQPSTTTSTLDLTMEFYEGTCGALNRIDCKNLSSAGALEEYTATGLKKYTDYYILVYHSKVTNPTSSIFNICITDPPPSNDDCSGAQIVVPSITCNPINGNLLGATKSTVTGYTSTYSDIWYKFTAVTDIHYITVSGQGDFLPILQLFSSTSPCSGLVSLGTTTAPSSASAKYTFSNLIVGKEYYYRIYHTTSGTIPTSTTFTTCVENGILNDNCTGAYTLVAGDPGISALPTQGIVSGASLSTPSTGVTCGTASHANEDVWYSFKATNQKHFFKLTGTDGGFKPCLELLSGACPTLTSLGCKVTTTAGGTVILDYSNLIIGQTYFLRVYNQGTEVTSTPNFEISVNTPPTNDDCLGAKEVTVGPTCTSEFGDGSFASQSPIKPSCTATNTNNDDVWFKFKADTTMHFITVNATEGYNPVIEVFKDDCATSLMCDDASFLISTVGSKIVTGLEKGKYYYYRIFDAATTNPASMAFTTCVVNVVENDRCEKAKKVNVGTICNSVDGDGTYATQSIAACTGNANDDVWYKFTATQATQFITITPSLAYDPVVQVFKDCSTPLPTPNVFCKDTEYPKGVPGSTKVSGLTIGTTYYYRVYDVAGTNPSTMGFSTCVTALPENDDCANAKTVYPGPNCTEIIGNGSYATESLTGCNGTANDDVWYKFTAQETSQYISVTPDDSKYDPVVQIFSACGTPLNATSCNDNSYPIGSFGTALISGLTKNSNYYYRVYDKSSTNQDTMTFKTCVVTPVVNDDCAGAIEVTVGATCNPVLGDGTYATQSLVGCSGDAKDDVWYKFKATSSTQFISVTPDDSKYQPVVQVFSACGTAYTPAVCTDLNTGKFGTTSVTGLQVGLTYYYRVYDKGNTAQDVMTFQTCVVAPVKNDECGLNATPVTVGQTCTPVEGIGTYATNSNIAACGSNTKANDDVWFSFVAGNNKQYINVTAEGLYDPIVQVFSACGTPMTGPVCNDSDYPKGTFGTSAYSGFTPGQTYYYRVYDAGTTNNSELKFTTCVVNPAVNDECANAKSISVGTTCSEQTGDGTYATQSLSASTGNANDDVWYKFRPTSSTHVLYVNSSSGYDPVVQLYSACPATVATEFKYDGTSSNSYNDVRFPSDGTGYITLTGLSTTQDYYYRVYDTKSAFPPPSPLTFTTCITTIPGPPENDNPCKAKLIFPSVNCSYKSYTNQGATSSPAIQPPGCGDYKGGDVWFKVVVPFSGQLTFDTDQEGMTDADMAIYTGNCSDLTLITCDDNGAATGNMPKISATGLIAGDTVYVRIWGKGVNNNGTFGLCVTKPPEATLVNGCSNLDFEGSLDSWFGTTGSIIAGSASAGSPNYSPTLFNTIAPQNRFQIETGGIDPFGGFPKVFQGAGSLRLGEGLSGNKGQSIEQYFTVTNENSNFVYNYAAVLQSGNHTANEQPYFKVDLYDDDGTQINCGEYLVAAPKSGVGDAVGFLKSPAASDVIYKPWTKVSIDLTNYIGKNVHVRFSTGSCSHTQHFGYVYLDCACSPFQIITTDKVCKGDTARFYAPKGAKSYNWRIESGTIVYTNDTDSLILKTTNSGKFNVYCDVEMFGTSLCKSMLDTTYEVSNSPTLKITDPDPICAPGVLDLFNPTIVAGSTMNLTYSYLENDKNTLIPDASKINKSGTYYIKGERSATCVDIQPVHVTINPAPEIGNKTATICSANAFTTTPSNTTPDVVPIGTQYTWTVVDNPNVTGESNQETKQNSISQTLTNTSKDPQNVVYTVTPIAGNCLGTPFTLTVTINPKPIIANKTETLCSGTVYNLTPTNGGGDIVPAGTTYTWTVIDNTNVTGDVNQGTAQNSISSVSQLVNTTNVKQDVTYTITPLSGTCPGAAFTAIVSVNPTPKIPDFTKSICTGTSFDATPTNSLPTTVVPTGTTYTWATPTVSPATAISGSSAQSATSTISQSLTNTTNANATATYVITANTNTTPVCSVTFNATITVEPQKQPVITCGTSSVNSISFDWTNIPSATSYSFVYKVGSAGVLSSPASLASGTTTKAITGLVAGSTVYFTLTPVGVLCPLDATKICSNCIQPTISNTTTPNNFEVCVGGTITLKASEIPTNNNQWTITDASKVSGSVLSPKDQITITGLATGTTDVNFKNDAGCINAVPITVISAPIVTVNNPTVCNNEIATITASVQPAGNYNYTWTVPTGATNPGNVASFDTKVAGNYTVQVSEINANKLLLCNIDFEDNQVTGTGSYVITNQSSISCWKTTASDGKMEIWNNGFQSVPSFSGKQFIELNATQPSTIYQVFSALPGENVSISFAHRGRSGIDVMKVEIGPVGGPYTTLGNYTDNNTLWGYYSVPYMFPNSASGNFELRFTAVSAAGGISSGNFLDAISIKTKPTCQIQPATSTLTVNPLPIASAGTDGTITCVSNVNGVTLGETNDASYTYSWAPSTNLSDPTLSNPVANPTSNETYTVTKKNKATGCLSTDDVKVTVNKPTVTAVAGNDGIINCVTNISGVTIGDVNNTLYSYSWSPNSGLTSSNVSNPTATPTATTTYAVTTTDITSGCNNTDNVTITVNKPTVIVSAGNDAQITCVINPNGLTIGDVNNVNYTYAWLPTTGLSDATISNPTANPSSTTTYSVTATETTSGCKASDNIVITYNKPTLSTTAGSDATITCITNTSGVTIGGANNAAYTYAWTPTLGLSSSSISNPIASPSATTTYSLTTTETATGCTNTDEVIITVDKPVITAQAGNDGTITCVSNTSGIAIGDVTNPAYSYSWSPATGLSSSTVSNPTALPTNTTNYTLTTTDNATGCFGTDNVTITINKPTIVADAGNDGTITCTANTTGVTIGENSNPSFTYAWTPSTTLSDATSANPIANPTVNQTYTVTKTDNATGCFDTDDVMITVNKPIIPTDAGTDATITCITNTSGVSIGENNDVAFSYSWAPATDLTNANSSNPIATPNTTTTFTLTKTEIATGCTGTDNVIITINKPTITAVAGNDGTITCVSNTSGIAIGDVTNPSYSYSWSPATGLTSSTISNPTALPTNSTNYTLTTTDNATGCFGTDNVTITINKPTIVADAGNNGTITCTANTTGVTIGENSNPSFTYAWTPSTTLSDATISNPIANPTVNQTYTVTKTDNATGCFDTDDVIITVNKPIIPTDAGTDVTITCITNTSGVSIGENNDVAFSYSWAPATDLTNANSSNPIATPNTTTTFTLTKTEIATGCTGTDNVIITINKPTITAVAGNDGTITCVNNTTGITIGDVTNPSYSYSWSPATGLTSSTISNPTALPTNTQNYTLTTTDNATGCFGTDNVTITINKPTIVADAGNDGTITCTANTTGVTIGENSNPSFTYAWTPSTTLSNATSATPIANPTVNQTYSVTKTDIASGCFDTDDVIITVNKPIVPINAGTDATITCIINTSGVSIGENNDVAYTYVWTPATDLTNANSANPIATPNTTTTFTLTKTEIATGCTGTDNVIITINKPTVVAIAGNDSPITCVTNNAGVTIGGANNISYNYNWAPTNGLSSASISNPLANPNSTTTYTVTTTDISSGCFSTDDVIISVDKVIPIADAGSDDFVSCITGTAPLEGINSTGGLNYTWTTNAFGSQIGNNSSQTTTTNKEGVYTLTVTNSSNGCSSTDQVTISLHTYPTLNPSSNSPICENQDLNLSSNSSPNVIYQWSGPNSFISSSQNPSITSSTPNVTGDYTLLVTDSDGCSSSKTISVKVHALPTVNATNSGPICIDASSFSLNETLGNGISWIWTSNGNAQINATNSKNPSVSNAIDGEIFTLTLTDVNGCVNTATTAIKINKLPIVSATNSGPICANVTSFNVNEIGGEAISWKWTKSGNATFSSATQKNPIVTNSIHNETFTVEGTDINGCVSKATSIITINPLPQFTVADNKPCDSTTLLLTTNYSNAKAYLWNGPNGYNSTVQNPIINTADIVKFEGNYSLKITDNNDCSNTINHAVDIIAKDNIQFVVDTAMCQHDGSKLLKANFNGIWSGDGISNPTTGLFSPNNALTKYMPSKNVVIFQSEGAPCPNKRAVIINVYKNPSVDFVGNTELCVDDTLNLINLSTPITSKFEWNFGNEVTSKDTNALYVYTKGGIYTITLKASLHGCDSSITKTDYIHVVEKPTNLQFTQSTNEIDVYLPEVTFNTNTEATYYHWSFGDGTSSMTQNPTHRFQPEPGNYLIRLTASNMLNHCSNYIEHIVVMPEPAIYYIPNTFTPNGDEFNNTFQPVFTMGYDPQSYSFFIYNRWGELIFESHDTKIGWDGTYGDNLVQNDTYIWKLLFKEKSKDIEHNETGHVNVLR